jgi:hypothetical protein
MAVITQISSARGSIRGAGTERHNRPIEAYCIVCDEFWPISESERDALGRGLVEGESHGKS